MDTSKYFSILLIFVFFNCKRVEYIKEDKSFYDIYLRGWKSSVCPKKIVFEKYVKNSNFKNFIGSYSDFEIGDCDSINKELNQRIISPNKAFLGSINYDIRLIINDSLEYKITMIDNKVDTVFSGGRQGDFIIMNNIKSFEINGNKLDNKNAPLSIEIPTNLGLILKKK
ncbi:hypothetical protein [Flavobacterium sp. HBTb2-11-1]|uniref:hypothetical protein n=1 Tax=Flavobacterium sp. HBTb2-11-1 TaxID=2692212 RepID=UPI0013703F7B|nr:hypothetical protein [Flavobacterium sp. HBTb2-11-1]MXO05631.1 hypothetical protein [Flavobacterium sp. HBTb2-11-1]